jgi:hypothetical protein
LLKMSSGAFTGQSMLQQSAQAWPRKLVHIPASMGGTEASGLPVLHAREGGSVPHFPRESQ